MMPSILLERRSHATPTITLRASRGAPSKICCHAVHATHSKIGLVQRRTTLAVAGAFCSPSMQRARPV